MGMEKTLKKTDLKYTFKYGDIVSVVSQDNRWFMRKIKVLGYASEGLYGENETESFGSHDRILYHAYQDFDTLIPFSELDERIALMKIRQ